jgi:hypothetical protein
MIPVEASLEKAHHHNLSMDKFRQVDILLALRRASVLKVSRTLPRLSDGWIHVTLSAQPAHYVLSCCINRRICLVNYTHKAAGDITIVWN